MSEQSAGLVWSPQQDRALKAVAAWLKDPTSTIFYLAGFAGTGKTTLVQHLVAEVKSVLYAAFTGKAASVMRAQGCVGATTLHSLMYIPSDGDQKEVIKILAQLEGDIDEEYQRELTIELKHARREAARPRFILNDDSPIRLADLVVLDECSMVNKQLGEDLMSFGKKVLVLGDPFQLPPVQGAGYFTSRAPDAMLTEIHRQARDNPIIRYSMMIREGQTIPFGDHGDARKVKKDQIDLKTLIASGSQLLTGKNETRRKLNKQSRHLLGYTGVYPNAGERLVCLKNDRELGVLNGVICTASADAIKDPEFPESVSLFVDYENDTKLLECTTEYFRCTAEGREPAEELGWDQRKWYPMDFGYCLTVHKSQGSQWPSVTLVDDGFQKRDPAMRQRWLYTAITRARQKLTIVL
jgi:exodeoxyribonuclease-5